MGMSDRAGRAGIFHLSYWTPAPSLQIGENLTESSVEFKPLSVADVKY